MTTLVMTKHMSFVSYGFNGDFSIKLFDRDMPLISIDNKVRNEYQLYKWYDEGQFNEMFDTTTNEFFDDMRRKRRRLVTTGVDEI
jgi:hypothetical protein